jgi:IS605 OrfB family transposase
MRTRELKLRLTRKQEDSLTEWLWILTGVYNWGIRKIKQDASDKIYYSKFEFCNLLSNHSKQIGIPSHTIQGTLNQAYNSWDRCFKKLAKEPKLKGIRNKFNSIPFPDAIPQSKIKGNRIKLPTIGELRFHKQELPMGKIKNGRIIKRASGWYLILTIDVNRIFQVKETDLKVGIDTGFKSLATLSDGKIFENNRYYVKGQKRLAQAQRGKNRKLVARLHERNKNRRKDYNHKVSKEIVQNYKEIYITNDNLKGQAKIFGKSVGDAGISQLRTFISYKGNNHGRAVKLVDSQYTTMTCSVCGDLTGPKGLSELSVRHWECACGAQHDRDVNSARVILNVGLGYNLVSKGDRDVK